MVNTFIYLFYHSLTLALALQLFPLKTDPISISPPCPLAPDPITPDTLALSGSLFRLSAYLSPVYCRVSSLIHMICHVYFALIPMVPPIPSPAKNSFLSVDIHLCLTVNPKPSFTDFFCLKTL